MLEVGRIVKPHGLRGDVIVELFTNRSERLHVGSVLAHKGGELEVVRSGAHQHRWLVHFNGIDSVEAAESIRNVVLMAEPIEDPEALWVHELIDAEVKLTDGQIIGNIVSVIANPAGDILEIDSGALVPLRFVVESTKSTVVIDPPEGLL